MYLSFIKRLSTFNFHLLLRVHTDQDRCNYCSEFTPIFQQLSVDSELIKMGISFGKIDGVAYKQHLQDLDIVSFPTILLFWKGFRYPIQYRKQRSEAEIKNFIKIKTILNSNYLDGDSWKLMSQKERIRNKIVIFEGQKNSEEYRLMGLIENRDQYFFWAFQESEKSLIRIGQIIIKQFDLKNIEKIMKQTFARVHSITKQSWLRVFEKKQLGILHFSTTNNAELKSILKKLAKQFYEIVFIEIKNDHEQFITALEFVGVNNEETIIAIDERVQGKFLAKSPYTQASLRDFIKQVKELKWPIYLKSENVLKPNKLTRENFQEKMDIPKDLLIFFYDRRKQVSKDLMDFFKRLLKKLQNQQYIFLLRCDVSKNYIQDKLGFKTTNLPKIVFYRYNQRNQPIFYSQDQINPKKVLNFILENTTFDFDQLL